MPRKKRLPEEILEDLHSAVDELLDVVEAYLDDIPRVIADPLNWDGHHLAFSRERATGNVDHVMVSVNVPKDELEVETTTASESVR